MIEKITELGVSVNVHFQPLPLLSAFRERGYQIENYPVALDNYAREISLPIYPELTDDQVKYVVTAVVQAYHSVIQHG
jgi:dTDP-4-amino-4,6-dideoxygalactose transaminase